LVSGYRIAELESEVSDVSLIGGNLAFEGEIVPLSVAVKCGSMRDYGVALSDHRFRRIGDNKIDRILAELPIDLKDRFEIAHLLRPRLRLQTFQRFSGLAITRPGQFFRRQNNLRLRPRVRARFGSLNRIWRVSWRGTGLDFWPISGSRGCSATRLGGRRLLILDIGPGNKSDLGFMQRRTGGGRL
jgi:hypothetical protein